MRSKLIVLAILAGVAAWALWDLYGPRRASLRDFDAASAAALEARLWRAYEDRREGAVFQDLARFLRTRHHMPWLRSYTVAYDVVRAAFEFKRGRVRADYERALPHLERYYGAIATISEPSFDPVRVARLELEWWIAHRQRELHAPEDLVALLAQLQAAQYGMPAEHFAEHARARADAMAIRDSRAEQGGVTEADWQAIEALLRESWGALSRAVRA